MRTAKGKASQKRSRSIKKKVKIIHILPPEMATINIPVGVLPPFSSAYNVPCIFVKPKISDNATYALGDFFLFPLSSILWTSLQVKK